MMKNLPVEVSDDDVEEMFQFADKDSDGALTYEEFQVDDVTTWLSLDIILNNVQVMVKPQKPPKLTKPHINDFHLSKQK